MSGDKSYVLIIKNTIGIWSNDTISAAEPVEIMAVKAPIILSTGE